MAQVCWQCGKELSRYHTGYLCRACQERRLEKMIDDDKDWVDAQGYAAILGLDSAEQLRRIARDGKLAPRIPAIKQWRWRRKDIEDWFKQKQRAGDVFRMAARGIASNMTTCRYDSVICLSLSDKIGNTVYGQELVLGTTDTGRVEPIDLVKVDRTTALKMLEQLPKKDFPELIGITDWADLTYDSINKDLTARLEAYF